MLLPIDKENKGNNISLDSKVVAPSKYILNVKKSPGRKNWEKTEMIFENYRVLTYRPGGIKVVRISDNKKLLQITDNYKIRYFNNGVRLKGKYLSFLSIYKISEESSEK